MAETTLDWIGARLAELNADEGAIRQKDTNVCQDVVAGLMAIESGPLSFLLLDWDQAYPLGLWLLLSAIAESEEAVSHVAPAIIANLSLWNSLRTAMPAVEDVLIRAFPKLSAPQRDWVADIPAVHGELRLQAGRDYQPLGQPDPGSLWPRDKPLPPVETPAGIQARLLHEGFNAGPITGEWNDQTSRALVRYQFVQGLNPTGKPEDQETLDLLREIDLDFGGT